MDSVLLWKKEFAKVVCENILHTEEEAEYEVINI